MDAVPGSSDMPIIEAQLQPGAGLFVPIELRALHIEPKESVGSTCGFGVGQLGRVAGCELNNLHLLCQHRGEVKMATSTPFGFRPCPPGRGRPASNSSLVSTRGPEDPQAPYLRQNSGVNRIRTEKISRRPSSMVKLKTQVS